MLASLLLVGHLAQQVRKLSREAISSPRVLSSLCGSFLCRVSSQTLYTCCWLKIRIGVTLLRTSKILAPCAVVEVSGSNLALMEEEDD
jgi:hypothetical protein